MSKSEKGFFKKNATVYSKKGNNNYIKIFNAIDKQEVYDEAKLLKKFKKESFVKHFAVTKKYLFDNILKGLKAYHIKHLISHQLIQLKAEAAIMMDRLLYYEALKHIKKAKDLAHQIEAFSTLLELLELERVLFGMHVFENAIQEKRRIDLVIELVLKKLKNQDFYTELYDQFYSYMRQHGSFLNQEDKTFYKKLLDSPQLKNIEKALSFNAKRTYWAIHVTYAFLASDSIKSYEASKEVMKLWEAHPEMISEQAVYYCASICTHINHVYRRKDIPKLKKWIGQLQAFQPSTLNVQLTKFQRYHQYQFLLIELTESYVQLDKFVQRYEEEKQEFEGLLHLSEQRLLLYNITHLYMQGNQYERALAYAKQLTALPKTEIQQNLQRFAYLLLVLVAYILNDVELLELTTKKHKKYIASLSQSYKYEQIILKVIASPKATWLTEIDRIEAFRQSPIEGALFQYLDFPKWMKQQIADI